MIKLFNKMPRNQKQNAFLKANYCHLRQKSPRIKGCLAVIVGILLLKENEREINGTIKNYKSKGKKTEDTMTKNTK